MTIINGYYKYGDNKAKIIRENAAYGYYKQTNVTKLVKSKVVNVLQSANNKNFENTVLNNAINKTIFAFNSTLNKSTNIIYYLIDNDSKIINAEILNTNTISLNNIETDKYYSFVSVGTIKTHTVTIKTNISSAIIKINGNKQNTYEAYDTEEISYEITAEGYSSISNTMTVTEDILLDFELEPAVLLTINAIPENAIITINGIQSNSVMVPIGKEIEYTVSAENYVTVINKISITENTVLEITLEPVTFTVNYPAENLPASVITTGIGTSSSANFYNNGSTLSSRGGSYHIANGSSYATIRFTTPAFETTISVTCYVSSEANYDYGMVYIGTAAYSPSRTDIKSGNTDGKGSYLFRSSGKGSSSTYTKVLNPNTTYYLSLKYAKDGSGNIGSDKLIISKISFICM